MLYHQCDAKPSFDIPIMYYIGTVLLQELYPGTRDFFWNSAHFHTGKQSLNLAVVWFSPQKSVLKGQYFSKNSHQLHEYYLDLLTFFFFFFGVGCISLIWT